MCRLTLALVLVAIAPWTCLGAEQILYDFWSSQETPTVLQAFQQVNVLYKFKVYGCGRYLILVENDQSTSMKNLTLPIDAFNVRTIPLEKMDTFLSHFNSSISPNPALKPLPDNDLTFVERKGQIEYNEKEMRAVIKEQAKSLLSQNYTRDMEMFVVTAGLPIQHIMFTSRTDYEVSELLLKDVDIYGGYKCLEILTQKIHKI